MVLNKQLAQVRISRQMVDAETALNDALIKQAMLFTTLVAARNETEVGQFTGQDALMRLTKSQQSLLAAGNDLARVHGRLLDIAMETGQVVDDCPDDWRHIGHDVETIAA